MTSVKLEQTVSWGRRGWGMWVRFGSCQRVVTFCIHSDHWNWPSSCLLGSVVMTQVLWADRHGPYIKIMVIGHCQDSPLSYQILKWLIRASSGASHAGLVGRRYFFFFFFINHLLPGLPTRLYVPLQMWDPGYIALLNICIQYKHYSYKFIQVSQVGKK